eukprot:GHVU01164176.1.p1 GENE.GHVU01164176.1~~GHVU01164176.1.p1  ORF type:complete len:151 (-),score=1.69 GHVU01164176.1:304-756(-)
MSFDLGDHIILFEKCVIKNYSSPRPCYLMKVTNGHALPDESYQWSRMSECPSKVKVIQALVQKKCNTKFRDCSSTIGKLSHRNARLHCLSLAQTTNIIYIHNCLLNIFFNERYGQSLVFCHRTKLTEAKIETQCTSSQIKTIANAKDKNK